MRRECGDLQNLPQDLRSFGKLSSHGIQTISHVTGGPRLIRFQLVRSPVQCGLQIILNSVSSLILQCNFQQSHLTKIYSEIQIHEFPDIAQSITLRKISQKFVLTLIISSSLIMKNKDIIQYWILNRLTGGFMTENQYLRKNQWTFKFELANFTGFNAKSVHDQCNSPDSVEPHGLDQKTVLIGDPLYYR